ncbi:MAG TPA: TRAP transporter substrate-binding protein [Clostridiaceae bacterium]|nr:TRAP transporter substrate-binding protein [Clostridiaceae bacterium]
MKKKLAILLCFVLLFVFTACGKNTSDKSGTSTTTPSTTQESNANEPIGPNITLKIGFSTNEQDPRGLASQLFKKTVEEKTGKTVTVEIYPSGQLGGDAALIEAMALDSGTVDIIITDASNFATYEPKMGISALPFLFENFEEAWAFMDSDIVAEVEKLLLDDNIRVLSHFCNGFRCVTTSKVKVNSPEDMKGMLIRTPENPVIMATMRALGANPQPLAFSELYMALQQGTYDAQENPIPVIYNNKLYEVQSYLSVTNHIYSGMCFAIAESTWKKMSPAQQEIVAAAAKEAEKYNRELNKQMTEDYISKLEAENMTIITPELAPFVEATKVVAENLKDSYGEELLAKLAEWQKNK